MHSKLLSVTIAAVLIGAAAPVIVSAQTDPASSREAALSRYMITFSEPGMVKYQSEVAPSERFDANQPEVASYRQQLMNLQTAFHQEMNAQLGRTVDVSHFYLATHSGMAALLTEQEAAKLRGTPGVTGVTAETFETLETQRGPSFIGADTIWSGVNVPTGAMGTRGEGMVIGVLDSGAVLPHPSFNNDPACGHNAGNPKVITALDCSTTAANGLCNGPSALDTNGHGSHTASTSGGNTVGVGASPAPAFAQISGVAPCASLRVYKVCPADTCPQSAIVGGLNSVVLHGDVSVINFSISGGSDPWNDNDRVKLNVVEAGVMVAASAGNTRAETPNPVGAVNHKGPWVLSVAASTHDQSGATGSLTVTAPGTPPAGLANQVMGKGSFSPNGSNQTNLPIRHFTLQTAGFEGCTPGDGTVPPTLTPIPAGFFTGGAALVHRGGCSFTQKITNAFNAGAGFVVIRNNAAAALSMATPGQPDVPAYSISQVDGDALVAFVDANPNSTTVNIVISATPGDQLAGFSLRGPTPGTLADLQKPNITGPGVGIYAATTDASGYGFLSGTSMSSPHLAGAATLVRKLRPSWTPIEVMSAMQMTAKRTGLKDGVIGTGQWDADDVGSGRVDLTKAALAGLVMNETVANFLAANPAAAGDVKTLNTPSVRDVTCSPSCTFTRTVRSVADGPVIYSVAVDQPTGFTVTALPNTIALNPGETQVLMITATPNPTEPGSLIRFGAVTMTTGTGQPQQHMTVAVQGSATRAPEVFMDGFEAP